MLDQLYQRFKNWQANQLLARIARTEPIWLPSATESTKRRLLDYIIHGLQASAQQQVEHAFLQRHMAQCQDNTNKYLDEPTLSPLLQECLILWADEPAEVYARRWIVGEIKTSLLYQKIDQYESVVKRFTEVFEMYTDVLKIYQAQEESVQHQRETLNKLTKEAERILQAVTTINDSMKPEKRMN